MVRTVWFAGFLLLLLLGLLAVRMVSSTTAASDDPQSETTSALTQIIPGENTLTEADRSVAAPDVDDGPLLPLESSAVRSAHAEYRPSDIMHRHAGSPARVVAAKPRATASKPTKATEMRSCRQLDPIARFLVSANLAPPCAG